MQVQRVISWLAVAALGLSIMVCPCSAMASDGHMDGHAHHQADSPSGANNSVDCGHEGCLNDCNSVSAAKIEAVVVSVSGSVESDDFETILVELVSITPQLVTLTSTGPPPGRLRRPADTPIRRHDRLVV